MTAIKGLVLISWVWEFMLSSPGVWGMMTWPLPGSNNIVLIDSYALFGIASLVVGVVLYKGLDIRAAGAIAPLGLPAIVYAFVIWSYGMTREPLEAGLMFFLTGLAALLSPLLAVQRLAEFWELLL